MAIFCRRYPDIRIELNKINRHGDIIAKIFAMAVYQRHLPERGLMAARVCCRTPRQPRNK
ncbi:coproporphyrinogen III oxidase [Klebsiella quasipneumoniae]|uniref:Coproporphyrinogen III oxidase n=1 Tax=Klebsiella quasipneumoniae TaxID=1463165 RepID=A0AAI8NMA5_9ENTR|nr:coproporphyrinogen III oxidase [Klebsiella quasipneumoniae]AWX89785.1 coproporphyrinogen III oxidase [Klebsiella quasipneumoniae subsp. quasipneumoniae]AWL64119.1 coproporphyrinogen III oxidase [Klebsiella quasipneumoniae]AWL74429.1 coproporphyrinogen III oxidase [Klebsiella quasipneumoniae]MBZ6710205.1 coproporphyrinogen III oxidase [Klebsiella quasipneumoniae]